MSRIILCTEHSASRSSSVDAEAEQAFEAHAQAESALLALEAKKVRISQAFEALDTSIFSKQVVKAMQADFADSVRAVDGEIAAARSRMMETQLGVEIAQLPAILASKWRDMVRENTALKQSIEEGRGRAGHDASLLEKRQMLESHEHPADLAALALCSADGDVAAAERMLRQEYEGSPDVLRKSFKLTCNSIFSGAFYLHGTYAGAARYRHVDGEWWILRRRSGSGYEWVAAGKRTASNCTVVGIELPRNAVGRTTLGGIIEIPDSGWSTKKQVCGYGPYTFQWNDHDF